MKFLSCSERIGKCGMETPQGYKEGINDEKVSLAISVKIPRVQNDQILGLLL